MIKTVLASLAVLLSAILYPTLSTTIVNSGILDPIPQNLSPSGASCKMKSDSKFLYGCENGQTVLDGKFAFLACAVDVESRYKWFPPTDKLDSTVKPMGLITLFDFSTEASIPLEFEGFPENQDFAPHGISALVDSKDKSTIYIAAVNHRRTGSVIELFTHTLGSKTLQYRKTVIDQDLLNAPNDIALVGKNEFYATNDIYSRGLTRTLAIYFRLSHGRVVFYDGDKMKTVLPNMVYPNGIISSDDMQTIYVASSLERKLFIYDRNEVTNRLKLTDSIDVGIIGDNLAYDSKTKSVLVTGHSHAFKFKSATESSGVTSPSVVVKVYPNTDKDLFYGKKYKADRVYVDDGKILSCGTIALVGSGASCYAIPLESSPLKSDPNFCLVLDDEFNDSVIDPKIWKHEITESGGGNWEFEWYNNNRSNSFVKDGHLYLMPTFTYDHMGPSMINGGVLDLWNDGCTQNGFYGCSRSSNGVNIINPIQSAKIQTINSVAINRGKVEVRAKLPTGDWIWPAIWMLPKHNVYGGWPASGEIDIMESRGNAPGCLASARNPEFANSNPAGTEGQMNGCVAGRDSYGSSLHWGPDFHTNRYPLTTTTYTTPNGKLLSDDFHTYGLLWTNDSIITYIDDPSNIVLKVPLSDFFSKGSFPPGLDDPWPQDHPGAPFDQEFYLILNVAVGGATGYFPDGMPNKPWSNTSPHAALDFWSGRESTWGPTWPNDLNRAMAIDSVKIWQQC